MCDRVASINKGRIVAADSPEKLKTMTGKREVLKMVVNNPGGSVEGVLKRLPFIEDYRVAEAGQGEGTTIRIYMRDVDANIQEVVGVFSKVGYRIFSLS